MQSKSRYMNLYHRITKNLKYTYHFHSKLGERFDMNFYNLFPLIHSFVYHRGDKYCNASLTINAKVSSGNYPNSDYLYSKRYDMILVFDRNSRVLITVEKYDTDYYFK